MSELAEQRSISDSQISISLLNVLIRAGLIGVVAVLCYMRRLPEGATARNSGRSVPF